MKKLLLILLFLPLLSLAQQTVGLFSNQPSSYNGYTLFNSLGSTTTYLIDNCGTKVYEWNSNYSPAAAVYLLENGNLLRTNRLTNTTFSFGGSGGGIEILDPNSNVIWSYEINSDSTLAHHDLEVLPNGNILILAIELISAQKANDYGSTINADRYSEMILEVNPSTSQIVWEWHAWDHLIQDIDPILPSYGMISEHPRRININYAFDGTNPDWLHANSIDYNTDLDQIIINIPTFNEFWIIDHSTTTAEAADSIGGFSGNGGDILYRWGDPQAYNRGDTLDQVLEFQHDAHWIPSGLPDEGKIMVFNNGQDRGYSSIDIIEPPLDTNNFNNYSLNNNSAYNPQSLFWSYSDSINFFSRRISGAQQLENGNILICSGNQGRIFEIEYQTDSVIWNYIVPVSSSGPLTQGAVASGNNVFRAHRTSSSYSGLTSLTLSPSTMIELNPLPSNCQIYIDGCRDSLACNYDPLATINDSSCVYPVIWQQAFVICTGDSVLVGSNTYNTVGNYSDTLNAVNGCDSIIYTNISITPPAIWQQSFSICDGDNVVVGSNIYDTAGNYTDTLSSSNGCDSIVYTNIAVDYNSFSYDTLSTNSSIVWNGLSLSVSGNYSATLINSVGCDSITNLNLTITTTGILNITKNKSNLFKITDMLGQETPFRKNTPLFYIYDDGTVEKKIIIE